MGPSSGTTATFEDQAEDDLVVVKVPDMEHRIVLGAVADCRGLAVSTSGCSRQTMVLGGRREEIDEAVAETRRLGWALALKRLQAVADVLHERALRVPQELTKAMNNVAANLAANDTRQAAGAEMKRQ